MNVQQHEIKPFYETPRVLVPGAIWVGAKEVACALGIGSLGRDALLPPKWKAMGIKAHLCPAFNVSLHYHEDIPALRLLVDDHDTVAPAMFDLAVRFHQLHGGATLVGCNGGRNRSVAFACALGVSEGLTLDECFRILNEPTPELVASLRAWAGPTPAATLADLEAKIDRRDAVYPRTCGSIVGDPDRACGQPASHVITCTSPPWSICDACLAAHRREFRYEFDGLIPLPPETARTATEPTA